MQESSSMLDQAAERSGALRHSRPWGQAPEASFDRIARLASRLLGAPVAVLCLLDGDRPWLKSAVGVGDAWWERQNAARECGYCRHLLDSGEPLVIGDLREHPLASDAEEACDDGWRAYLGVPLVHGDEIFGVLSVADHQPRQWTRIEIQSLQDLAASAESELDLRRSILERTAGEERLAALSDASFDGLALHEGERLLEVNEAFARMHGYTREELIGRNGLELLTPASRTIAEDRLRSESEETYEVEAVTRDGCILLTEVRNRRILYQGRWVWATAVRDVTDQKEAQVALQESVQRHQAMLQALPDLIFRIRQDGTFLDFKAPDGAELYVPADRIRGGNVRDLLPPDVAEQVLSSTRRALDAGQLQTFEYTLPVPGRGEHFEARLTPSGPGEVLAVVRDVSERVHMNREIQESGQRFRTLFDEAARAVLIHDVEGRLLQVNQRLCQNLGYTREELLQLPVWEVEVGVGEADLRAVWRQMRSGVPTTVSGTHRRKDGTTFPVEVHVNKIKLDGQEVVLAEAYDITDRKAAEDALERSEARYRSLTENALDLVTVLDADAEVLYESPATEPVLGFSPDELVGRSVFEFIHPDDHAAIREVFQYALSHPREMFSYELRFRHKDGHWVVLDGIGRNLLDDPAVRGIVANSRDITERVEAQHKLEAYSRELERSNRELQDFAYVASHDLQEPLRKIHAFGDRLKRRHGEALGETGADYLERMQKAATRMQALIQDLLAYSRVTSKAQPFAPVDLTRVTEEVIVDLQAQVERTDGRVDLGMLPTIDADAMQMRQLLQNLIGNALKFHREGAPPVVDVSADVQRNTVHLRVCDNGIGFEEEYLERIFAPFERLHGRGEYEGTGMGLAICRKIAHRHGGDISVCSTVGEGTTFTVVLPISHATERGAE